MQQVILFFIRNKSLLLFFLLFAISVYLTIQAHSFHSTKYVNSTSHLVGGMQKYISSVGDYFHLKKDNELLQEENAYLRELLHNENRIDQDKIDSISNDFAFQFTPAKVISNSYTKSHNILTINKGAKDGIEIDMGVITPNGIVGIVNKTSENYATVQSILNTRSQINAKLKETDHFGLLVWEKIRDPLHVHLIDIPRHTEFSIGDTIVTGGKSTIFPEGIHIGIIDDYVLDEVNNAFTIRVKLFADMTSLNSVYLIHNFDYQEIINLQEASNNGIE